MPTISRRTLLASAAASAAIGAVATRAQDALTVPDTLAGKSILITGTSSGFGRLMAESFARKGAKVFATMRNLPRVEAADLERLAAAEKLDLTVISIDVRDDQQVADGVERAEELAGGALDVLINNAGVSTAGPIEIQDMAATQLLFDTNVYGPQRMMRAALPAMRKAGSGQIINVTSQLGRVLVPGFGQYSPSKFALEAMSEQIAYELVPHNIDVTIIQPGGYPTQIWANANELTQRLLDRAETRHLEGYPMMVEQLRNRANNGGNTDPMDVPDAIAAIIAMPPGTRPLRQPVHPGPKPQIPVNAASRDAQLNWLGDSAYGPWVRAVHQA